MNFAEGRLHNDSAIEIAAEDTRDSTPMPNNKTSSLHHPFQKKRNRT